MSILLNYFLIFFLYSVLGWFVETGYIFIKDGKFVDRGFLIGPYCPIYGVGSVLIISYLTQYKDNIVTVFLLSMITCAFVEYMTSYLMEKIFKARWWDYSEKLINLNGRVCFSNALLFGIGGVFIIYIINPIMDDLIYNINDIVRFVITLIFLVCYVVDAVVSFKIVNKLKSNLGYIEVKKDSTQEIKNLVAEVIKAQKITSLQKRIIRSFPNFELQNFVNIRDTKFNEIKNKLFGNK